MIKRWIKRILIGFGGFLGLIALVIGVIVVTQVDFSNDENLDRFIEKKMKKARVQGLSAVIIKNGEISWAGDYGYADKAASRKVADKTIFQIASVSKTVTGTAVMQLYERGVIDLDASINTYLPFQIINPHHPDQPITTRMLLQHKSSVIDNDPVYNSTYTIPSGSADPDMTLEAFVRAYFLPDGKWYDADKNFSAALPGAEFSYSNTAFGLLGYLVEHVSGRPFNAYCREQIFTPLGMTSTGWLTTDIDMSNLTVQYDGAKPLKPYSFATYSDGSLKTTTRDFARFLMAIMNGGSYEGQRILAEATVREMLPENHADNLVWHETDAEHHLQGHGGGDPGISTEVYFNPNNRTGIVVFMNTSSAMLTDDFRARADLPMIVSYLLAELNLNPIFKRLNTVAQIYS